MRAYTNNLPRWQKESSTSSGPRGLLRPSRGLVAPRWRAPASSFSGNDPGDVFGKLKNKQFLDAASKRYQLGLDNGIDEDEMVTLEFGSSEVMDKYKDKIKEKLQTRAAELKAEEEERLKRLAQNYLKGKEAYEIGEYSAAVRLLERGVEEAGPDTQTGGECQLWLALSYMAVGKEQEAIETCKYLENNHPSAKIKKQAFELRYIFEAPKLTISDDEVVKIPLIQSDTWRKPERKSSMRPRLPKAKPAANWDVSVPEWIPLLNTWYYQGAFSFVLLLLISYLSMQVR